MTSQDLLDVLFDNYVSDVDIIEHLFRWMDEDTKIKALKDLCIDCDIELEDDDA